MPIATVGDLDIAFDSSGEDAAPVILLLHGWPDDASTWDYVVGPLNAAGFRTIVPSLRGFGETRFRSDTALRTGNSGILAMDAIGLMDVLGIDRFVVVGHDWGSNIAEALAVGWPERVEKIAMLSSPPRLGGMPTPPFWHAQPMVSLVHGHTPRRAGAPRRSARLRPSPLAKLGTGWLVRRGRV